MCSENSQNSWCFSKAASVYVSTKSHDQAQVTWQSKMSAPMIKEEEQTFLAKRNTNFMFGKENRGSQGGEWHFNSCISRIVCFSWKDPFYNWHFSQFSQFLPHLEWHRPRLRPIPEWSPSQRWSSLISVCIQHECCVLIRLANIKWLVSVSWFQVCTDRPKTIYKREPQWEI